MDQIFSLLAVVPGQLQGHSYQPVIPLDKEVFVTLGYSPRIQHRV
jgi:hypothetical protein